MLAHKMVLGSGDDAFYIGNGFYSLESP